MLRVGCSYRACVFYGRRTERDWLRYASPNLRICDAPVTNPLYLLIEGSKPSVCHPKEKAPQGGSVFGMADRESA